MPDNAPDQRSALISVSDKRDLVPFARALRRHAYRIIATGGTAKMLADNDVEHTSVSDITRFPEILDGRVKTLHPAIHGAILADRDNAGHVRTLEQHDIAPIDIVCINLYPFRQTVAQPGVTDAQAIEQIDIGGPAMLRAAAKNHAHVAIVVDPDQYDLVVGDLDDNAGATSPALRRKLAARAFATTASYDGAITRWLNRDEPAMPPDLAIAAPRLAELRYGENPHQHAALYAEPGPAGATLARAEQLHGKALSYNNLADADAALAIVRTLARTPGAGAACAVVKHTNPCGAAGADRCADAILGAMEGDRLAAYGGILACSHPVDAEGAKHICAEDSFFELVIAPDYEPDALETLRARWKNVRILRVDPRSAPDTSPVVRPVDGGLLAQQPDDRAPRTHEWRHSAGPAPDPKRMQEAGVVWSICAHLTSNAIAIGGRDENATRLFGAGAGQMDRVASCRIAIEKAGDKCHGAIAASDAFFPFPDGPELLVGAGVSTIVHPGGSKRDDETFDLCERHGVTCITTGRRHFRH